MQSGNPACREADSQVRPLQGFYQHGRISVVVIGFLTALNWQPEPSCSGPNGLLSAGARAWA